MKALVVHFLSRALLTHQLINGHEHRPLRLSNGGELSLRRAGSSLPR